MDEISEGNNINALDEHSIQCTQREETRTARRRGPCTVISDWPFQLPGTTARRLAITEIGGELGLTSLIRWLHNHRIIACVSVQCASSVVVTVEDGVR